MKELTAFIFARSGSKGIKDKNIKSFMGKPLIAWSIEHAFAVEAIKQVYVSTDCEKIARIAESYGAAIPFMRPRELASDDTPEWLVWQHAIRETNALRTDPLEIFISVPVTAPLRIPADIQSCIDEYRLTKPDIVITVTPAKRNPYFNMVRQLENGFVSLVNKPAMTLSRRQDAPQLYDIATVAYVANPNFILTNVSIFDGDVRPVIIPEERAVDIDTILDFKFAELLASNK